MINDPPYEGTGHAERDVAEIQALSRTPFGQQQTAELSVQFAIDPSKGLTRERYAWFSNGTQFDKTHFSADPGEITISTSATGSDTARIRSAYAGQYISQTVARPGAKIAISSGVSFDSDGYVSTDNGLVQAGPFFWDSGNTEISRGFGLEVNTTQAEIFWRSNNSSLGNSPIAQPNWSEDDFSGNGGDANPSGLQFTPGDGWILNFPYWWYNSGKLTVGFVDPVNNQFFPAHEFNPRVDDPGTPNLDEPNLPVQVRVDNDGDATTTTATLGGMQFSTSGEEGVNQVRDTYGAATGKSVTTATDSTIDPINTQGEPLYAVQRESNERGLELQLGEFEVVTDNDIIVYFWDEFNPSSALTNESFESTFRNNGDETKTEFDRSATAYSPSSDAVFRGLAQIETEKNKTRSTVAAQVEENIPIGAARIVTATDKGTDASVDYVATNKEGY